jgi:hypothetical protein
MDEVKDFENFYTVKLQPLIANLKAEAGAAGNWGVIAPVTAFLAVVTFAAYQLGYIEQYSGAVIAFFIVAIAVSVYFYSNRKDRYTRDFKETIIREIIYYLHPGIIYKPDEVIAKEDYKHSGLFRKNFDWYDGDDYMEGIYKNVSFRCSELLTQYESGSRNLLRTIFKGLFFVAEINISLSSATYVWASGEEQTGGSIADERYRLMRLPNVNKIKLECASAEFENIFSVYSTNPSEAGSILTKAMTERLIKFKKQVNRDIAISFVAGRCYFAIAINEDLLEPSGFDTDDREEVKKYFFTVLLILSIINQLHLNELQ